ncbi:MAG TPA: cytidylate kinase-like family protein [Bacteroidales bacterium]|nr:cytidylate kinase-like family protein [Bacteroidales bacterium]
MAAEKIDLSKYLHERYLERNAPLLNPGPVVTISREMGCPGKKISQLLQDALNRHAQKDMKKPEWKWVSKEIFESAAKELDLEPERIIEAFKHPRGIIDEIIHSQSKKYYVNDRRIRKTIGEVIRSMANDGHVIILGRGGVALTRDIPKSLHISLEAPLDWRAALVSEKHCMSIPDAKKYIKEIDERRAQYRAYYQGKNNDYTSFDVRFNCMSLSLSEIVDVIIKIMEIRKLI